MQILKLFLCLFIGLIFVFDLIVSCPTSLGKKLLDTNQISYRDLSKQNNLYE